MHSLIYHSSAHWLPVAAECGKEASYTRLRFQRRTSAPPVGPIDATGPSVRRAVSYMQKLDVFENRHTERFLTKDLKHLWDS